jgi:pimeloyl-ACP methyl ester carboxylesterase
VATAALRAAQARLVGRSALVATSSGQTEYAVLGDGAPVLVIHGAAGGFDQGLEMTGGLAEGGGYRLIAPSRFGYLRSALPDPATAARQADLFVELLDRIGVDRVAVIEISAGAWSALQFAVRHPDRCRALVLLVPAAPLPPGVEIHGGAVTKALLSSDILAWALLSLTTVLPGLLARPVLGTDATVIRAAHPSEQARVRDILRHLLPVRPRLAGMTADVRAAAAPEPCAAGDIHCPVLAISAEDDAFGTAARARAIAAEAADGQALIFPSGGHALVGRQAQALEAVRGFLDELDSLEQARPHFQKDGRSG